MKSLFCRIWIPAVLVAAHSAGCTQERADRMRDLKAHNFEQSRSDWDPELCLDENLSESEKAACRDRAARAEETSVE